MGFVERSETFLAVYISLLVLLFQVTSAIGVQT